MPEETQSERIKYNIEYLNLSERQCEIHDIIMQSLMNTWPPSLLCYLEEQAEKYGFCGELIVSCVADWITEREGEE